MTLLLAGTLTAAAVGKTRAPEAFAATATALAKAVPALPAAVVARSVPAIEAGLAIALAAGGGRTAAAACALLLLAFTVVLGTLRRHGVSCACFGASPTRSGVGRNVGLLAVAGALVAAPSPALWTMPAAELMGAATAATGAACAWTLARELAA